MFNLAVHFRSHVYLCLISHFSHILLFVTLWTVAHQVPQSMRFSRQENWNGLPCPSPWDCPDPGIKPASPALQVDSLPVSYQGRRRSLVSMGSQRVGYYFTFTFTREDQLYETSAYLPNHPTLSLSYRVQKSVLYICVSFAVLHTGWGGGMTLKHVYYHVRNESLV